MQHMQPRHVDRGDEQCGAWLMQPRRVDHAEHGDLVADTSFIIAGQFILPGYYSKWY
jgi:hypothetical protein